MDELPRADATGTAAQRGADTASVARGLARGEESRAVLMVVGSAVSLQFGAAVAVILLGRVGPVGAVALRLILAAAMVLAVVRPKLRGRPRGDLAIGATFGIALGVMNLCFYEAAARLPLGAAVTLEFLGPLGLAIVMSRRLRDLAWAVLAGLGVFLLYAGGLGRLSLAGVAFALAAAACWAGYILLGSQTSRRFPGGAALAVALGVSATAMLPVLGILIGTGIGTGAGPGNALLTRDSLLLGVAVAFLSSALPYSLELAALRRIPPRTFGVLMCLEPAVAAVAGFLVLDQVLAWPQILAIGFVIAASAGATLTARSRATGASQPGP